MQFLIEFFLFLYAFFTFALCISNRDAVYILFARATLLIYRQDLNFIENNTISIPYRIVLIIAFDN